MAKDGEIEYFNKISPDELRQATEKPYGHPEAPSLLANFSAVLKLLPQPPGRILDMGCGTGWTSILMARAGYQVTGEDISPEAVRIATELGHDLSVKFKVGDFETQQEGDYDAVIFFDCLHHSERPISAIETAFKSLVSGGRLITVEPGWGHHNAPASIKAMQEYGVTERSMPSLYIRHLAKKVGFKKFETYPVPRNIVTSNVAKVILHTILGCWVKSSVTVCIAP